jgi:ribose/xylose/arabinose/galactoside ABC-type transport system permease subunit
MAWLKRLIYSEHLVLLVAILYFAALAPFTPGFATPENLGNILATLLPLFIVAMGQTIVLITGGIDLSVTSIIALASVIGASVMNGDNGWLAGSPLAMPAGLVVMLAVGAAMGAMNGLAIAKCRMPPFIVKLTAMMFFSGFAIWLTKSKNINNLPASFNALGGKTWIALLLAAALAGAAHAMLNRSLWGRWLFAIGHNARASRISGVPVDGVIVSAYAASGFLAAMAAVLYTGQAETGSPVLGQKILLDVIGGTVIGGASLFGGKGGISITLFGVLFIKLIDNSLNLLDLSYFSIMMVKGGVILFAALLDSMRNKILATS